MKTLPAIIAVDFDGTCVKHEFPAIGADVPGAVVIMRFLVSREVKLILWTMRSNDHLAAAVEWFREREIPLWGINENRDQGAWTDSPKVYAPLYIDDAAFGCPLIKDPDGGRPYVDWDAISDALCLRDLIGGIMAPLKE